MSWTGNEDGYETLNQDSSLQHQKDMQIPRLASSTGESRPWHLSDRLVSQPCMAGKDVNKQAHPPKDLPGNSVSSALPVSQCSKVLHDIPKLTVACSNADD